MKDRPVQLMSDTAAALKAAKEVSADSLAPDIYRRANDNYFRAQNEYRLKNFAIAEDYAQRAKSLAEEAEFEALEQGSSRTSLLPPDEPVAPPPPSDIEPPQGVLATEAMKREASGQPAIPGVSQTQPGQPAENLPTAGAIPGSAGTGSTAPAPSYPSVSSPNINP